MLTGKAVVHVLERLGHTIEFPMQQTCCGQMHWNTGYHREAMPIIRHFVETFRDAEVVCIPSSSCVAMIRDHYLKAAESTGDSAFIADVETLLPRVYEFSEFLVNKLGVEDVGATYTHRVTYHASCHSLRSLHLGDVPFRLLRKVRGIQLVGHLARPNGRHDCGPSPPHGPWLSQASTPFSPDLQGNRPSFCASPYPDVLSQ